MAVAPWPMGSWPMCSWPMGSRGSGTLPQHQFPWPYPSGSCSSGAISHRDLHPGGAQLASSDTRASDRAHSHGQFGTPGPARTPATGPTRQAQLASSDASAAHFGEPSAEMLAQQFSPRRQAVSEHASEHGVAAAVAAEAAQEASGTWQDPMGMTALAGHQPSIIDRRSRTPIDRRLAYDGKGYSWLEFRSWYGDHALAIWQSADEDPLAREEWAWIMVQVNANRRILQQLVTRDTPRMKRLIANSLPLIPGSEVGAAAPSGGYQASVNDVLEAFAHSYE